MDNLMRTFFVTAIILPLILFCGVQSSIAGDTCETICQSIKSTNGAFKKSIGCAELCHNIDVNVVPVAAALCKRSIKRVSDYDLCTELVLDLLLR